MVLYWICCATRLFNGLSVYQLSLLEVEDIGEGTPQGVVLALVGPEPDSPSARDTESTRSLRMYNLKSLSSLARWAVAQKVVFNPTRSSDK